MVRQRKRRRSLLGRIVVFGGRLVLVLVLVGLVLVLISALGVNDAYRSVRDNIEQIADIDELPQGSQPSRLFARDYDPATGRGTLLGTLSRDEKRQLVDYYDLPPQLVACVLSIEDARFFEHGGVDFKGLARAGRNILLRGGEIRGGGSTITQQLSRNVFLPYIKTEKTLNRKIQEVILAFALEKRFTKHEILEAYCNHIFFGSLSYGVRSAAWTYFGKQLDELTLAECALLAGLPQAPTALNPKLNPEAARARRDSVLRLLRERLDTDFFDQLRASDPDMFGEFTLTRDEVDAALAEPIVLAEATSTSPLKHPYFSEYLWHNILDARYGEQQVQRQGYTVVSTLDPLYQQWAEEIVKERIDESREAKHVSQAAVVLLERATGEVLACVGGYQWHYPTAKGLDETNRALIEDRPVGSAFKPFTYATAYEQGFSVGMTLWDGPNKELSAREGKPWPRNSDRTYWGWISAFYALQLSRNAAAVDLLVNCTGFEPVIETARKMGLTAELEPVPALTLGVHDIKPVEMAEAFDTFPNMGRHVGRILVKKVYDQDGILLEANDGPGAIERRANFAFSENTAWIMVQNMYRVVEHGTGYPNALVHGVELIPGESKVNIQVGGKTGTNDDFADAWFIGYSPELVCAVWVGNDDYGEQMNRVYGGHLPAQIFQALMKRVYSCQYQTVGEGENAVKILTYEPRYTKSTFEKPPGATFNGFPGAVTGTPLIKDEEGNWQLPDEAGEAEEEEAEQDGGDGDGEGDEDDDFYKQWEPPPKRHVYF